MSFPALGTWIEILDLSDFSAIWVGRSLHWERGLKYLLYSRFLFFRSRRSLHWERGLKFFDEVRRVGGEVVPCIGNVD